MVEYVDKAVNKIKILSMCMHFTFKQNETENEIVCVCVCDDKGLKSQAVKGDIICTGDGGVCNI